MAKTGDYGAIYIKGAANTFTNEILYSPGNFIDQPLMNYDSNFDGIPEGWTLEQSIAGGVTVTTGVTSVNNYSWIQLAGTTAAGNYAQFVQTIPTIQGKYYSFSVNGQVSGVTGTFKGRIFIAWYNSAGSFLSNSTIISFTNTTWQQIKLENITPPVNAVKGKIVCQAYATAANDVGYAYFYNAQFEESATATTFNSTYPNRQNKWSITNPAIGYLLPYDSYLLESTTDGSTWAAETEGYFLDPLNKLINFYRHDMTKKQFRLSGRYYSTTPAAAIYEWKMNSQYKNIDVRPLYGGYGREIPGNYEEVEVDCGWYWAGPTFENIKKDTDILTILYLDTVANQRYVFFSRIADREIKAKPGELINESLKMKAVSDILYFNS